MNCAQFSQFADFFPGPAVLVTTKGRLVDVNRAAASFFGRPANELKTQSIGEFCALGGSAVLDYLHAASRSRSLVPGVLELHEAGKGSVHCRCDAALCVPSSENQPAIIFLQFRAKKAAVSQFQLLNEKIDLLERTNRKLSREIRDRERAENELTKKKEELEAQSTWLESVLHFMPIPLLLVEPGSARVAFANKAADALAGGCFPRAGGAAEYDQAYLCTDESGARIPIEKMPGVRVAKGEALDGFPMNWHLAQGIKSLLVFGGRVPTASPRLPNGVVAFLDVTSLRETEKALRHRTRLLERANEELKRFAYVSSHDMKEPLRMVVLYNQLLARRYKGRLGADADDYIRFSVEAAKRMTALIEGILSLTSLDSEPPPNSPTDLNAVVREVTENLKAKILETGARVDFDSLPRLPIARAHAIQLFQNLLSNALNYSKPAIPPEVSIRARNDGREWIISVTDNGIGIAPEYFEKIFLMFQRLHTREAFPGSGIGLATCKKIVEGFGGRIWVESAPGQGATFFFTSPVA